MQYKKTHTGSHIMFNFLYLFEAFPTITLLPSTCNWRWPRLFKTPRELAGKAPRLCSVSSLCRTCCCSGARRAHIGAQAGWSCRLCRSMGEGGRNHRRRSRPVTPSGHLYSWNAVPVPRNPRSWACCGGRHHRRSGTNTRCTLASVPRWSRYPRYGGTGPSGGWLSGKCNTPPGRVTGRRGRGGLWAGLGGTPGRGPAEPKHLSTPR